MKHKLILILLLANYTQIKPMPKNIMRTVMKFLFEEDQSQGLPRFNQYGATPEQRVKDGDLPTPVGYKGN